MKLFDGQRLLFLVLFILLYLFPFSCVSFLSEIVSIVCDFVGDWNELNCHSFDEFVGERDVLLCYLFLFVMQIWIFQVELGDCFLVKVEGRTQVGYVSWVWVCFWVAVVAGFGFMVGSDHMDEVYNRYVLFSERK